MSTAGWWVVIGCALASAGGYLIGLSSQQFQRHHRGQPLGRVMVVAVVVTMMGLLLFPSSAAKFIGVAFFLGAAVAEFSHRQQQCDGTTAETKCRVAESRPVTRLNT